MVYPDFHTHRADAPAGLSVIDVGSASAPFAPRAGCYYSAGLHPWRVDSHYAERLAAVEQLLRHEQVVAVGECGIDRACTVPLPLQEQAFAAQLELAARYAKPVVLHVVHATDRLLHFAAQRPVHTRWVVHGFSGGAATLQQLLRVGLCVSFGARFHAEAVRACPADRLFVESDAGTDRQLADTYRRIAALRGITPADLAQSMALNLNEFIKASI